MLLRVEIRLVGRRSRLKHGRRAKPIDQLTRTKQVSICRCDQCQREFEKSGNKWHNQEHHFCSWQCKCAAQKSGGLTAQKQENTCLKRHGVRRGMIKPDVLAYLLTASHSIQAELRRGASLKKWHASRPSNWQHPGNSPEAWAKRHNTMKLNGTYRKSIPEDQMYDYLCSTHGTDQIQRNVWMNDRWPIDFYIKSINTYVQLDGVYWHGLDRPIEVIAEHRTKRDEQIHKKWLSDRSQDEWFKEQGLKLIRITDTQFLSGVRP